LTVNGAYGPTLGLFPVNVLHDLVHIVVGVGGIALVRSVGTAWLYCRIVAAFSPC
jgi:hypothetical protein